MSNESKHTPAPWNANKSEVYELSTGKTVARTDIGGSNETTEANARIIAAAPEMLKACQAVVAAWESGDLAAAARLCNDAINKATE